MSWTCLSCETANPDEDRTCEVCGAKRIAEKYWICGICETSNDEFSEECVVCGNERAEEALKEISPQSDEDNTESRSEEQVALLPSVQSSWSVPGVLSMRKFDPDADERVFAKMKKVNTSIPFILGFLGLFVIPICYSLWMGILTPIVGFLIFFFFVVIPISSIPLLWWYNKKSHKKKYLLPEPDGMHSGFVNGHSQAVIDLHFLGNKDEILGSVGKDSRVITFDQLSGAVLRNSRKSGYKFSTTENHILLISPEEISLLSKRYLSRERVLTYEGRAPDRFCVSNKTGTLLGWSQDGFETAWAWNGKRIRRVRRYRRTITYASQVPFDRFVLLGLSDGRIEVLEIETGKPQYIKVSDAPITGIAFKHEESRSILVTDNKCRIFFFEDFTKTEEVREMLHSPSGHPLKVNCICFAGNRKLAFVGDVQGGVYLIDVTDMSFVQSYNSNLSRITALNFSDHSKTVFAGDEDGKIASWPANLTYGSAE